MTNVNAMMSRDDYVTMLTRMADEMKYLDHRQESLSKTFTEQYRRIESYGLLPWFEPRKVISPPGYLTFKSVSSGLWSHLRTVYLKKMVGAEQVATEISGQAVVYQVLNYRVPVYFVADNFIRAVAATELPSDFTINDLHWPMPGMTLSFPTKFMRELTGREICYINCAHFDAETAYGCNLFPNGGQPIMTPHGKVAWQWYSVQDGNLESYVGSYRKGDRVNEALSKYSYVDYTNASESQVLEDKLMADHISTLILKLLVILNTRPQMVVPGQIERQAKLKHGKLKYSELWSPNVIGAAYHVLRAPGTGTHASPRWHWRKGHLTHQRRGSLKSTDFISVADLPRTEDGQVDWDKISLETKEKFWACHERRWIEPMLINFDE